MNDCIQTYETHPQKPNITLPPLACDSHCHIFGPANRFPFVEPRSFTPVDAPKETLFALHELLSIQRCVIVQTALHGFDNSVVVDAMQARPGTYLGIALSSATVGTTALKEMYLQGFRGIRFNFMAHLKNSDSMEDILDLTKRLDQLNMHLQVHFSSDLVHELAPLLKKSAAPVMIDHIGRVDATLGENHKDFQALLHLMDDPKMHMKVSGIDRIVKGVPYTQGIHLAKIMVDQFTDKCVWGTDWPHPNHHHIPQDGMLVDAIGQITDTPEKLMHIMVKNPERFYGFK